MPILFKSTPTAAIQQLLMLAICIVAVSAWSPHCQFSRILFSSRSHENNIQFSGAPEDNSFVAYASSSDESSSLDSTNTEIHDTRRRFLNAAAMNIFFMGATVPAVIAADSPPAPGTRYISGKGILAPGEVYKKSDNTKGTRRDPDFLRSISDCRSQCQSAPGPDGLANTKEDCLSECQDICCKTYEQCTFNIVPRL